MSDNSNQEQGDDKLEAMRAMFLTRDASSNAACPSPELIAAARAGESSVADRDAVIDHIAGCSDCTTAWRLAGTLILEEPLEVPAQPVLSAGHRRWSGLWGVAAAVLISGGLVLLLPQESGVPSPSDPGVYRGEQQSVELSAQRGNDGELVLGWSVDSAEAVVERADVLVLSADLDPVVSRSGLSGTTYTVAAEALLSAGVDPSEPLLWQVVLTLDDGTTLTSATASIP